MLGDVLSVLAVTVEDKDRDCLHFRLAGSKERISSFGHPYIRWCALFGKERGLLVVDAVP